MTREQIEPMKRKRQRDAGSTPMGETLLPEVKDIETRAALGEAMESVFDTWGLEEAFVRAALLGLPESSLQHGKPLPSEHEVLERTGHLLAIHRALRRLYADDFEREADWLNHPDERLDGRSPLNLMLVEGLNGIKAVRAFVDTLTEAFEGNFE